MYKHYIRLDENNFIIKGYSDAFQNDYIETDICIYEGEIRQFFLEDYVFNPKIFDDSRVPNYIYTNNLVVSTTQQDKDLYKSIIQAQIDLQNQEILNPTIKYYIIKDSNNFITEGFSDTMFTSNDYVLPNGSIEIYNGKLNDFNLLPLINNNINRPDIFLYTSIKIYKYKYENNIIRESTELERNSYFDMFANDTLAQKVTEQGELINMLILELLKK